MFYKYQGHKSFRLGAVTIKEISDTLVKSKEMFLFGRNISKIPALAEEKNLVLFVKIFGLDCFCFKGVSSPSSKRCDKRLNLDPQLQTAVK